MFLRFLIEHDIDLLNASKIPKDEFVRLCSEFENTIMEQNEEHLDYDKNEEDSYIGNFLNKYIEQFFIQCLMMLDKSVS